MGCQSRNRRPSATSCSQRSTSYAFHQPHPAAHRTSSDPENPSRLGLRKTFLNGLNDAPAKVFLGLARQRASILFSHARHTTTLSFECHLYYAPISKSGDYEQASTVLEAYIEATNKLHTTLKAAVSDPEKKSDGFKQLEAHLRVSIRVLNDLVCGLPVDQRDPFKAGVQDLQEINSELIKELFPRQSGG